MQTFREIVKSAGKLLLAHPVGEQPHVKALWEKVEWVECDTPHQSDAAVSSTDIAINLYPLLNGYRPAQADAAVLREFGLIILRKASASDKARWKKKLVIPTRAQIASVQAKLQDEEIRRRCATYEDFMKTFSTAMDRLVCINVTNALLANKTQFVGTQGIDITTWGPTSEYASLHKYHSIIPFTSAYAPPEVHRCYGCAFAEMVINKMRAVRESSTAKALEGLIRDIAAAAP